MKKKNKLPLLLCASVILVGTAFFLASCDSDETQTFIIEYGEVFTVEHDGKPYTVRNSLGETVKTENDSFCVIDMDGYIIDIGDCESAIKISVQDTTAPKIHIENPIVLAQTGKTVNLTNIYATDAPNRTFAPTATLESGEKINLDNFFPTENGIYKINLSAKDFSGNEVKDVVYVDANENGEANGIIARLSASYSTEQISHDENISVSYDSTESALKIDAKQQSTFALRNLLIDDVSYSSGIYTHVYNANNNPKTVVMFGTTFNLFPKEWTKLYVPTSALAENVDKLSLSKAKITIDEGKYYFSDVAFEEYLPWMDYFYKWLNCVGDFNAQITSNKQLEDCKNLYRIWNSYPEETKNAIISFQSWHFKNHLGDRYEEYFTDSYAKRLLQYYFSSMPSGSARSDKIFYNDSTLGALQFTSPDNSVHAEYDSAVSYHKPIVDKQETGSLKLTIGALSTATMRMDFPLCDASEYNPDNIDNGTSIYSKMYFYAYCEDSIICTFNGKKQEIQGGKWTKCEFRLDNITNEQNQALACKRQNLQFINANGKIVYITSIYTSPDLETQECSMFLDYFLADETVTEATIADNMALHSIYEMLEKFSLRRKSQLLRLTEMHKKIKSIINPVFDGDTALLFNTPYGRYQITAGNADATYTASVSYDGTGSLQITSRNAPWSNSWKALFPATIAVPEGKKLTGYIFYAYLDGGNGQTITLSTYSIGNVATLKEKEWVAVRIPAEDITQSISIICNNWYDTIPVGMTTYFSSVRAIYEDIEV